MLKDIMVRHIEKIEVQKQIELQKFYSEKSKTSTKKKK